MILLFDSAQVNAFPASISRPADFGHGITITITITRRPTGPTLADLAFEAGRTIGLEAERFTDAPAGYSAVEVAAFRDGQVEAMAVLEARESDHLAELADADAALTAVCNGHVL
jgi:hypothetical protein